MLKNRVWLILSIIFLLTVCINANDFSVVNVQGIADYSGNKTAAYNKALADAFRRAVEKGLGVMIKSNTEVKDSMLVKDKILSSSEGYVTDHEVLSEDISDGVLRLTVRCEVAINKIGADVKTLIARLKTSIGNPSIAFVLTTWEFKGDKSYVSSSYKINSNVSGNFSGQANYSQGSEDNFSSGTDVDDQGNAISYAEKNKLNSKSANADFRGNESAEIENIKGNPFSYDESVYSKVTSFSIIDAFQQEFLEKGFDLKASDKAREIAGVKSVSTMGINLSDRKSIIDLASKEGANFVARGEAEIISKTKSSATGNWDVTVKVGCEIIDVSSMDIVATYSNTSTASHSQKNTASEQAIKKSAVLGAKKLASLTIDKWQDRANNGMKIDILIQNIKSSRSQKRPLLKIIGEIAQITNQANPTDDSVLISIQYKGTKTDFEEDFFNILDEYPQFSEDKFDGPFYDTGKLVFKFID